MAARRFVQLDHRPATAVLVDVTPAEAADHRRVRAQMRVVAARAKRRAKRHPDTGRLSLLPDLAGISLDALAALESPALRAALARVLDAGAPEAAAGFNSAL